MTGHHAGASRVPPTSSPPLAAAPAPRLSQFIRRLPDADADASSAATVATVAERLQRARLDHLRHRRNIIQAELRKQQRLHPGTGAGAASPHAPPPAAATASPRVVTHRNPGLAFLSYTSLNQQERDQQRRDRQFQRSIAGPVPPQSWRRDRHGFGDAAAAAAALVHGHGDLYGDGGAPVLRADQLQQQLANASWRQATLDHRREVCSALRVFLQEADAGADTRTSTGSRRLPTLRNMALCVILSLDAPPPRSMSTEEVRYRRDVFEQSIAYLLPHLQGPLMSLNGREARLLEPSVDTLLSILRRTSSLFQDPPLPSPPAASSTHRDERDSSEGEGGADSWDAEGDDGQQRAAVASGWKDSLLDLSFYSGLGPGQLRSLLNSKLVFVDPYVSLRALSLAGLRLNFADPDALLRVLDRLANLELLSLAGSHGSVNASADRGLFLKRLSRATRRLQALDLSYCGWIDAQAICFVSWSEWPRLDHLVLKRCEAFQHPAVVECQRLGIEPLPELAGAEVDDARGKVAASFVAPWHARHHGHGKADVGGATVRTSILAATRPGILPLSSARHRTVLQAFLTGEGSGIEMLLQRRDGEPVTGRLHGQDKAVRWTDVTIRCPTSGAEVALWTWHRAVALDAVRGRLLGSGRRWIEVWF
ncbi:hypothetical protein ACQY0O_007986 [Thecaphora frezii]